MACRNVYKFRKTWTYLLLNGAETLKSFAFLSQYSIDIIIWEVYSLFQKACDDIVIIM